jgi:hypothetical protein
LLCLFCALFESRRTSLELYHALARVGHAIMIINL